MKEVNAVKNMKKSELKISQLNKERKYSKKCPKKLEVNLLFQCLTIFIKRF